MPPESSFTLNTSPRIVSKRVIHHAMRRGKYSVKLHPEQITQIRKLHSEGHNQVQLGKKFGVTNGMICHIIKGRKWSWIS